ncbi:MAG: hypothetical protein MRY23_06090 [Pelagibacteraceae bacterium]|nr:hypothetical protein [Pelagibacteraceae bacterium]MCI5078853.1 hypothetical protein [Pelagibacteraceae bacterium]
MKFLCTIITPSYKRVNFLKKQYLQLEPYLQIYNCEWMVCLENDDFRSINYIKSIRNKNVTLKVGSFGSSADAYSNCYRLAKGKFLNFSGDDDVRTKLFFLNLKKFRHYPVIIGRGIYVDNKNKPIRKISTFLKSLFLYFFSHNLLRTVNFIMSPAVIYRKEIAIQNKGLDNLNYPWTNDYELNLRITKKNKCKVINKIFVQCYFSSSTITGKYNLKKIQELIKINLRYNKHSIFFLINLIFLIPILIKNLFKFRN